MKLQVTLKEELTRRFQIVKERTGLKNNTSVVKLLISKECLQAADFPGGSPSFRFFRYKSREFPGPSNPIFWYKSQLFQALQTRILD